MNPVTISAIILTLNEEANIKRCIDSLKGVADEILVVDSYSSDRTEEICKQEGVRFAQNRFEGFIEQENFASKMAISPYQFIIDADEEVSLELKKSLVQVKANWQYDAYSFNRLACYCGSWIKHCGWYPDKKIRLIDLRKGFWGGENPHHRFILNDNSKLGHLRGDVLHYAFNSIQDHVATANNYSTIAAHQIIKKGKYVSIILHLILNPLFTFFSKYFLRLGFLDGYYGFVICTISAIANYLKYSKALALKKK